MKVAWCFAALLSQGALLGCGSSAIDGGSDAGVDASMVVPLRHRAAPATCPPGRAAYNCSLGDMGFPPSSCSGDPSCAAGTNGRCVGNPHDGCNCSYDTCAGDGDCAAGTLCDCRDLWHYGDNGPNSCLPSNCRVDADCGQGGYCSPTLDPSCGSYGGVSGWYCHTPQDGCVNDADCAGIDGGFIKPYCGYRPELGRWECSIIQCAG